MQIFYLKDGVTGDVIKDTNGLPIGYDQTELTVAQFHADLLPGVNVEIWQSPQLELPLYSQRDPLWSNVKLGYGNTTIGQYGCLLTCIAMIATHAMNDEITPPMANEALKQVSGFTGPNGNLLIFSKVTTAFPILKQAGLYRYPYPQNANTDHIDNCLSNNGYPIIQVDMDPLDSDLDEHWTLITDKLDVDTYTINDPWTGKHHELPPAYSRAGWLPKHAIFSIVLYQT